MSNYLEGICKISEGKLDDHRQYLIRDFSLQNGQTIMLTMTSSDAKHTPWMGHNSINSKHSANWKRGDWKYYAIVKVPAAYLYALHSNTHNQPRKPGDDHRSGTDKGK